MASLDSLAARLHELANRIDRNRVQLVKTVALTVDQTVVTGTPVDTGRARSNWLVSIGEGSTSPVEAYSEGKNGSTAAANLQAATAQAEATIGQYQGKLGEQIQIVNNLPYIKPLNEGHSAQAPAGYIEAAIMEAVLVVQSSHLL